MKKITEILREKKFTISVELVPPRNGTDPEEIYNKIEQLRDSVDFIAVTKGAGGSLRGGTLPISYLTQEKFGINSIAHFVCREHTKEEIENELVDLHYLNIKNILALRGDPPAGLKERWKGDYKYAYLLVNQIKKMNNGMYLPRNPEEGEFVKGMNTDFCVLVAGHPEDPIEEELKHIRKKIDAGAEVIITQMIFSFDDYKKYVEALKNAGINVPVIPGIRPLVSLKQVNSVENFFKLKICNELKEGIEEKGKDFGLEYFVDLIRKLREYHAPGVHFFVLNDVDLVKELLEKVS
ncbi:MAG: methylenetetrahydrofolate reductase [Candidatus Aenigmarchaeota archaeon]|nr:methylenetetrahydrofolate reductase [Candidatus Aenigmarchaeota archaeon]